MKELTVKAVLENLEPVQEFVRKELESLDCSPKVIMQIEIAVEEIYVNIAHYAYNSEIGDAVVRCEIEGEPPQITIQFLDEGVPFDPLEKEDADITLSTEKREIGGLGILMVKKSMDEVEYFYKDKKNILTIKKNLRA